MWVFRTAGGGGLRSREEWERSGPYVAVVIVPPITLE